MKILTSITFLSLLTCITKEDNWAITITHANAKSKLCHSLFLNKILQMNMKSDFIQPVKLVTNYYALQKFLVYVMFSTHNMGWSNNQTSVLVSYRSVYILFHELFDHSSCSFFNVSYKFWLPFSCYDILCWQNTLDK